MTSVDIIACNMKIGSDDFEKIKTKLQSIIAGIIGCEADDLDEAIPVMLIAPVRYSCKKPFMKVLVCTDEEYDERRDIKLEIEAKPKELPALLQVIVIKELSAY